MAKYTKLDAVGSNEAKIEFSTVVEPPVITAPTAEDKNKGRCLQGRPTYLEEAIGERLATEGLAAKTDEGWVRGYKWHQFYKV